MTRSYLKTHNNLVPELAIILIGDAVKLAAKLPLYRKMATHQCVLEEQVAEIAIAVGGTTKGHIWI